LSFAVRPLVNPTICYLPLAFAKAHIIAAVARIACLGIALDHTHLKQRLGPLRDRGESPACVARRRPRRSFIRRLRRIDRLLKGGGRAVYGLAQRLFLNAIL
jgi:hypothetical protein